MQAGENMNYIAYLNTRLERFGAVSREIKDAAGAEAKQSVFNRWLPLYPEHMRSGSTTEKSVLLAERFIFIIKHWKLAKNYPPALSPPSVMANAWIDAGRSLHTRAATKEQVVEAYRRVAERTARNKRKFAIDGGNVVFSDKVRVYDDNTAFDKKLGPEEKARILEKYVSKN